MVGPPVAEGLRFGGVDELGSKLRPSWSSFGPFPLRENKVRRVCIKGVPLGTNLTKDPLYDDLGVNDEDMTLHTNLQSRVDERATPAVTWVCLQVRRLRRDDATTEIHHIKQILSLQIGSCIDWVWLVWGCED